MFLLNFFLATPIVLGLLALIAAILNRDPKAKPWVRPIKITSAAIVMVLGVLIVHLGAPFVAELERAQDQEFQAIHTEIAGLKISDPERVFFLKKLDPKPAGGVVGWLLGDQEEITLDDANLVLRDARAVAEGKKWAQAHPANR